MVLTALPDEPRLAATPPPAPQDPPRPVDTAASAAALFTRLDATPLTGAGGFYGLSFTALGSPCRIEFAAPSPAVARRYRDAALRWLAGFEARYSRFRPDSLLGAIHAAAGRAWIALQPQDEALFALCDWFFWTTRGLFDPTTLPLLQLWDYRRADPTPPEDREVEAARALVGWTQVRREPGRLWLPRAGMGLDLGGIGKEFAVDRVLELGLELGLRDLLVDFGHDLRVHGEPPEKGPWRIGLEDPHDPGHCWGGVAVRDRAVCTSGDYLRHFTHAGRRYGHILDPRSGRPVAHDSPAVSVIAPTCTEAGIYATSALILGAPAGLELLEAAYQVEGCLWQGRDCLPTRRFDRYVHEVRP